MEYEKMNKIEPEHLPSSWTWSAQWTVFNDGWDCIHCTLHSAYIRYSIFGPVISAPFTLFVYIQISCLPHTILNGHHSISKKRFLTRKKKNAINTIRAVAVVAQFLFQFYILDSWFAAQIRPYYIFIIPNRYGVEFKMKFIIVICNGLSIDRWKHSKS